MSLFSLEASTFLKEHTVSTLSSVDSEGKVHGAVVYYLAQSESNIYFVSKTETTKIKNIRSHPQVALTILDAPTAQTLQITGNAFEELDHSTIQGVFDNIVKLRPYNGSMLMPPVTALKDSGDYIVIRIVPTEVKFSDYKHELESNRT